MGQLKHKNYDETTQEIKAAKDFVELALEQNGDFLEALQSVYDDVSAMRESLQQTQLLLNNILFDRCV